MPPAWQCDRHTLYSKELKGKRGLHHATCAHLSKAQEAAGIKTLMMLRFFLQKQLMEVGVSHLITAPLDSNH